MRYPRMMAALTATTPGMDWAMETRFSVSLSSSQPYSSTYLARSSGMITKPPPTVNALMRNVDWNSFQ